MLPTEGKKFRNVIVGMGRLYGQELDQLVLDAYWLALSGWEFEDFEDAARHLMQTAKFMPRPADFHELRQAGRPTAGEAWATVLEYARAGVDPSPHLESAAVGALRSIGGIRAVMMSETDKTHFLEKRFAEHFEAKQDADDVREAVPQIADGSRQRLTGPQSVSSLLSRFADGQK